MLLQLLVIMKTLKILKTLIGYVKIAGPRTGVMTDISGWDLENAV